MKQRRRECLMINLIVTVSFPFSILAENIALGKPATQLGTFKDNGPERAVDGNTNQILEEGSCAHPDSRDPSLDEGVRGTPAWWSVDLAAGDPSKRFIIQNITIYFRMCCTERIPNTLVLIGTTDNIETQLQCAWITSRATIQNVDCRSDIPFRFLTLKHQSKIYLGICEVIIEGYQYKACSRGWWGKDCKSTCPCSNNVCNDVTGKCQVSDVSCNLLQAPANGKTNVTRGRILVGQDLGFTCDTGYFVSGASSTKCLDGSYDSPAPVCIVLPSVQGRPIVVSSTSTSVTLSFTTSQEPVDEYQVEYAILNSQNYIPGVKVDHDNVPSMLVTQTQLQPGTNYQFRIVPFVMNMRGTASLSNVATTERPPTVQGRPYVVRSTQTSVTLSFTTSQQVVDEYQVEYSLLNSQNYIPGVRVEHDNVPSMLVTQTQLQPGTTYQFRVVPFAMNVRGEASLSNVATTETLLVTSSEPSPETSPPGKGSETVTDTVKIGSRLTAIISGVVAAVIVLIILAIIITYLVTRSRMGKPVTLGCRTCVYVKKAKRSPKKRRAAHQTYAGPAVEDMRDLGRGTEAPDSPEASGQPDYEALDDTSYQEISPPYTDLVPDNSNKDAGRYINIHKNEG